MGTVLLTLSRRLAISALIWCGSYFVFVEYPEKAKQKENIAFNKGSFQIKKCTQTGTPDSPR